MSHWTFVIAAYAVTVAALAGLIGWAFGAMRRAEAAADRLRK